MNTEPINNYLQLLDIYLTTDIFTMAFKEQFDDVVDKIKTRGERMVDFIDDNPIDDNKPTKCDLDTYHFYILMMIGHIPHILKHGILRCKFQPIETDFDGNVIVPNNTNDGIFDIISIEQFKLLINHFRKYQLNDKNYNIPYISGKMCRYISKLERLTNQFSPIIRNYLIGAIWSYFNY